MEVDTTAVAIATDAAVLCPLCEYDLRGLIEPRCPECGYRFEWAALTDPALRVHPYLFEHHPRHNIWSFIQTARGGIFPTRFWKMLQPQQPSSPKRLIVYWVIGMLLPSVIAGVPFAAAICADQEGWSVLPTDQLRTIALLSFLGSAIVCGWTVLTILSLFVFQQSMRKANVRGFHLLRCVLYSLDISIVLLLDLSFMLFMVIIAVNFPPPDMLLPVVVAPCLLAICYSARRLWVAYRDYLRFDHPFWVIVASQVIVVLAAFTGVMVIGTWNDR